MRYGRSACIVLLLFLTACAEHDLYGKDPHAFYAAHPIENRVDMQHVSHDLHFRAARKQISMDEVESLRDALSEVSPQSAESIVVQMHPSQANSKMRREEVVRVLSELGYAKRFMVFEPSQTVDRDEVRIDVSYASVIAPDCPDWRLSPVTTYSNGWAANMGCASANNLGAMVADPHDLVRGRGNVSPDSERNSKVLTDYRSGKDWSPSAKGGEGGGDSGASGAMSALGGGQQ